MIEALVTGLILAGAAVYLIRYFWRATHGKPGGCGCGEQHCGKQPK